ncbi:hypothetical protein ATN84_09815 [Paramesorhizobium deserti]|uniref:Uncharacterized protein n=1 Tax=Paramesorhizobium deserti TaxID=1494590 RepID=A0A135HWR3_9HYPH|nr:hypothetical protein [Paramesorhizobium deserti]KXF77637.1 hypothetical protein ATN84_09815 [Paramesorhizobium deserti]
MNDTDVKRIEVLSYIQQMLGELRSMAHAVDYPLLAYFIEMAYIESEDTLRGERDARLHRQKRDGAA